MGVPQWGPEEEPVMGVWVQGPQKLKNRSSFNANYRVKFNDNSKIDQQSLSNNRNVASSGPKCPDVCQTKNDHDKHFRPKPTRIQSLK